MKARGRPSDRLDGRAPLRRQQPVEQPLRRDYRAGPNLDQVVLVDTPRNRAGPDGYASKLREAAVPFYDKQVARLHLDPGHLGLGDTDVSNIVEFEPVGVDVRNREVGPPIWVAVPLRVLRQPTGNVGDIADCGCEPPVEQSRGYLPAPYGESDAARVAVMVATVDRAWLQGPFRRDEGIREGVSPSSRGAPKARTQDAGARMRRRVREVDRPRDGEASLNSRRVPRTRPDLAGLRRYEEAQHAPDLAARAAP